jgi:hypothetical protein
MPEEAGVWVQRPYQLEVQEELVEVGMERHLPQEMEQQTAVAEQAVVYQQQAAQAS